VTTRLFVPGGDEGDELGDKGMRKESLVGRLGREKAISSHRVVWSWSPVSRHDALRLVNDDGALQWTRALSIRHLALPTARYAAIAAYAPLSAFGTSTTASRHLVMDGRKAC
jgi:hypothetical protein